MKKTYFVCSDIHGYFDAMINELRIKKFNINNKNHILIICGDLFDRGPDSFKVYVFVKNLLKKDRVILIKGNHEDNLYRMLSTGVIYSTDTYNGTMKTIFQFLEGFNIKLYTNNICFTPQDYKYLDKYYNYIFLKNFKFIKKHSNILEF